MIPFPKFKKEYIQVYNPLNDKYESVQVKEIRCEEDDIYLICDSGFGYSFPMKLDNYGKWGWILNKTQNK